MKKTDMPGCTLLFSHIVNSSEKSVFFLEEKYTSCVCGRGLEVLVKTMVFIWFGIIYFFGLLIFNSPIFEADMVLLISPISVDC